LGPKGNAAISDFLKRAINAVDYALKNPAADPLNNQGGVFGNSQKGHGDSGGAFKLLSGIPQGSNNRVFDGVSGTSRVPNIRWPTISELDTREYKFFKDPSTSFSTPAGWRARFRPSILPDTGRGERSKS
jgi:hypothetical protein